MPSARSASSPPAASGLGSRHPATTLLIPAAAIAAAVMFTSPARAATEIMWWHAMSGQLGKQLVASPQSWWVVDLRPEFGEVTTLDLFESWETTLERLRAHRNNIHRYQKLLATHLSDLEPTEAIDALIASEIARWKPVIARAQIKPEGAA